MKECFIEPDASLIECIRVIDRSSVGIALVVDEQHRLIGTLSDGDVRRALIKGFTLDSPIRPHINLNYYYVSQSDDRTGVLDIMQARKFAQVPILDEERRVVGLHLLHEILGRIDRPNWALIMAGGKGTRMRPLTDQIPKPMLRVAGRPILERILLHIVSYGIRRIFIAVNYLAHVIQDYFQDGSRYGCSIEYILEEEPLGSGGAVGLLPETPKYPLLLINGDLVVDINLAQFIEYHKNHDFFATMAVHPYVHEIPYGCVGIKDERIVAFHEKPILEKTVNAGIYLLSSAAVDTVPRKAYFPITALFENGLRDDLHLGAFHLEKEWIDIGHPGQLRKASGKR